MPTMAGGFPFRPWQSRINVIAEKKQGFVIFPKNRYKNHSILPTGVLWFLYRYYEDFLKKLPDAQAAPGSFFV